MPARALGQAPKTRFGELLSSVPPDFSHQHDGCQAQGKGVGGGVAKLAATQSRLPSWQLWVLDIVKRALVTEGFGGKRHSTGGGPLHLVGVAVSDFRFRELNGHQNRGCRLPLLTRNGPPAEWILGQASGSHSSKREPTRPDREAGSFDFRLTL